MNAKAAEVLPDDSSQLPETVSLRVPHGLVKRVNDALLREGLAVRESTFGGVWKSGKWQDTYALHTVVEGVPPAGVPRVIAHDGPPLFTNWWERP